jgi:hypothetical protein
MPSRLLCAVVAAVVVLAPIGASPGGPVSADTPAPIAIIGDSIIAGNLGYILPALDARGVPRRVVDALSSRKTSLAWFNGRRVVTSGIDAVRALRAGGAAPQLWVIELGTNDSFDISNCRCPDPVGFAGQRIDALRAELGPDARVLWVNVRTSSAGALAYNEALARRAGPHFVVADWKAHSAGRTSWFVDAVHPSVTGARELASFLAGAILAMPPSPAPLPDLCIHGGSPDPSSLAVLSGEVTAAAHARRCRFG